MLVAWLAFRKKKMQIVEDLNQFQVEESRPDGTNGIWNIFQQMFSPKEADCYTRGAGGVGSDVPITGAPLRGKGSQVIHE